MSYWDYAGPTLQTVAFALLVIFLVAAAVSAFFGTLGSFMGEFMRNHIPRVWWILASLLGITILIFGVPFAYWLHAEWWPTAPVYQQKSTFEEFKDCNDAGSYWYQYDAPGGETIWVCSKEPMLPEDLQPAP